MHPSKVSLQGYRERERQASMLTLMSLGNLETPVKLTHMSLNCVGKLEYLERTYTSTRRTLVSVERKTSTSWI